MCEGGGRPARGGDEGFGKEEDGGGGRGRWGQEEEEHAGVNGGVWHLTRAVEG